MKTPYVGTLATIAWGEHHFGSLITNRVIPMRGVMRCVRAGLARSIGMVAVCDDDGHHVEPERYREGFVLTEAGVAALRAVQDAKP